MSTHCGVSYQQAALLLSTAAHMNAGCKLPQGEAVLDLPSRPCNSCRWPSVGQIAWQQLGWRMRAMYTAFFDANQYGCSQVFANAGGRQSRR